MALVGILAVVLGAAFGVLSGAAIGLLFVVIAAYQYRVMLMRTASELSLDDSRNTLYWRATMGQGELDVTAINRVRKSNRPAVYEICSSDGSSTAFWLNRRGGDVSLLFETLGEMNPGIDMSDIYRRSLVWWRGLPNP
jgi:hypothetical protein